MEEINFRKTELFAVFYQNIGYFDFLWTKLIYGRFSLIYVNYLFVLFENLIK